MISVCLVLKSLKKGNVLFNDTLYTFLFVLNLKLLILWNLFYIVLSCLIK